MGLEPTDPRIVIDSDVEAEFSNTDFAGPFPTLGSFNGENEPGGEVPPEFSSGNSIPDAGIGQGSAEAGDPVTPASARKRVSRLHRDSDSSTGNARDATTRPPSLDEWTNFFGKIVLRVACDWYLSYAFRGIDEDQLSDRELERLAMTDDERKLIATPLAELSNKSKFMRKHGRMIVASGDSFNAMVVMGAWISRVNRIAAKHRPHVAKVRVNDNGSSGPGTQTSNGATYSEGATGGRIPNGFPVYRGGSG